MEGSRSESRAVDLAGSRVLVDDDQPTFWDRVETGLWEPATLRVLERFVGRGTTFVDLGAWVGPLTLLAATRGARVIAVEADPAALAQLRRNLAANPALAERITLAARAASSTAEPVRLGARRKPGDSMSSALLTEAETAWVAPAINPSELGILIGDARDLFVKVDVEGGEYTLLPALIPALDRPGARLLVSFHPDILREAGQDVARATDDALAALRGWTAFALEGELVLKAIDVAAIERSDVWLLDRDGGRAY